MENRKSLKPPTSHFCIFLPGQSQFLMVTSPFSTLNSAFSPKKKHVDPCGMLPRHWSVGSIPHHPAVLQSSREARPGGDGNPWKIGTFTHEQW
jgi:hypothetical protein